MNAMYCHDIKHSAEVLKLYTHYSSDLRSLMRAKTGCVATADDLVQDCYLRLLKMRKLDEIQSPKSYLYRMCRNLATDHFRSHQRRNNLFEYSDTFDTMETLLDEPSIEDSLSTQQTINSLNKAVEDLSPLCQMIFWSSRKNGFKNNEVAKLLDVSLSTVEKNISKATQCCFASQRSQSFDA